MQAAFISYAVFLAVFLIAVAVVFIIVGVRALLAFIRGPRGKNKVVSGEQPPISDSVAASRQNDTAKIGTQ
jgi:hypothetical protein